MRRLASAAVALSAAWVVVGWPRPAPAACEDVRDLRIDGNYDRARREAKACLERHPRRITPLMELSRIHAAQGRVDRALEYVERALDRAPDVPAYRFWRIELLLRSRQLDRARRALGALPEDVASRPRALKLRGKFELWRKNYRGALRYLNRYLQKRPESPRALYYRGISREKTSRWSGAISDYRRACELANGWSRPCEAASALERARRDVGGLLKRVRRLVGEGEPDRALDLLDRAISRVPDRASLKYWRIRILMRENRVEQARRALSKLPPAMLDRPAAMKLRSSIEMRRENWAAALESLNLYLERRPAEPRALHRRGRCREQLGRWETARSDYRRACSLASGWMEPCRAEDRLQRAIWEVDRLVRRSRRQARAGRGRRARQLADRAYSRRPKGDEVALWHLELTMEQQRWGEVRSAVEHLPNSARDAPLGFLARARLSERDGNVERARGLYSRYLGARPDDADARYRRGLLRYRAGDIDGAAADFVRACRVEPGHVRACRAARGGVAPGAVRAPTFRADIRSGVELTGETFTGYSTAVGLSGWIERATRLELDFEWRDRSVEGREATDGRVDVGGMQLLDNGVRFAGGGGAALEPDFAPHWHAYLQGGYRFSRQFAADLRYWRIQFQPIGEHVVSPRANFTAGRFELRWRHFVSFTDLGEVHVASLLETGVDVAGPTRWHFGLGAGDGRDYLELRRSADDGHILIRAGFRHDLASKHRLGLDLTHRRDELGKPEFPRTRFQLVYEFVRR